MDNETYSTLDAIRENKCQDTSRCLHDISIDRTQSAHDKNDARKEQMDHSDRRDTVTKQVTGNEFFPRRMWFFPPLLLQGGNPCAQFCVSTSNLQASTSTQDNYVIPLLTNDQRQKRKMEFRCSSERRISEDSELRERVFLDKQPAVSPAKHGLSQHLNASFTNSVSPNERHSIPGVIFAQKEKTGERCGIYPFDLQYWKDDFELTKGKTVEGEREQELVAARDGFQVVSNSHKSNVEKRASENQSESVSPKRFRNSEGQWNNGEQEFTFLKDDVFVLENSHILNNSETVRKAASGSVSLDRFRHSEGQHNSEEHRPSFAKNLPNLETMKITSVSPERFHSNADHWKIKQPCNEKLDENKTNQVKPVVNELSSKQGWKQSNTVGNEAIPEHFMNNFYHRFFHRDWLVPRPPYFNSVSATENSGFLNRSNHYVRTKSKTELSSIWFPFQLTPNNQHKGVTQGYNRNDIWYPELRRVNGHLHSSDGKEIFTANQEGINAIETKRRFKNFKNWLTVESLSPNCDKEFSNGNTRAVTFSYDEEHFKPDLSRNLEVLQTASDEESLGCLPDHSTVNTVRSPRNTKEDRTVQSFEHHEHRIPSDLSLPGRGQIQRSGGLLTSSGDKRTKVDITFDAKRNEGRSLNIVNVSNSPTDLKKEDAFKTFGFQNTPVRKNLSSLVKRDSDRPFSPVRSPEENWTSVAVTDDNERLESSRLEQEEKEHAVNKPGGKVFSDHSTLCLLNKETKTHDANVHPKLPPVNRSSPPFWSVTNGFAIPSQLRIMAGKSHESSSKLKETLNLTHHHRCEVCNSTFPLRRLLNRHLKTHSFYKRYSCSYCEKGFNDTFDLKRHVRTHTGIKPFKCDRCDKSFTQRCSLEAHQSRVHGIVHKFGFRERRSKMFVCEQCGATFRDSQTEFMNHMANEHPETEKSSWVKKNNRLSRIITF